MSASLAATELAPPAALKLRSFRPPILTRLAVSGADLVLVEDRTVPLVHILAAVPRGAGADPPGREGLAALLNAVLFAGGTGPSGSMIAARAADQGADLVTHTGWELSTLAIELLDRDLGLAVAWLLELLRAFAPSPATVEAGRKRQIAALRRQRFHPAAVADGWLARTVFGESRAGRPAAGTEASVNAISATELKALHGCAYGGRLALVVTGSFAVETLVPEIEDRLADHQQGGPQGHAVPHFASPSLVSEGSGVWLVDLPWAAQTELRVGGSGPGRLSHDFVAFRALGRVLQERLMLDLRQKRGWSYGVKVVLDVRSHASPWQVRLAVEHGAASQAVRRLREHLEVLCEEPPAASELEAARRQLATRTLRSFLTLQGTARKLADVVNSGLPIDYHARWLDELERLEPADLLPVARAQLDPSRARWVVAGPANRLRTELGEVTRVVQPETLATPGLPH